MKYLTIPPIFAKDKIDPVPPSADSSIISLNPATESFDPLTNLTIGGIISGVITLILIVITLVFFFMVILGGLKWITANGDEKAVGAARSQITNALIGLAIVFVTWAIIKLVETIFGISILGGLNIPTFQP